MTSASTGGLPILMPAGATDVTTQGPRPFVTRVRYVTSDGRPVTWKARTHRKSVARGSRARGLNWWIGLLFAVGSLCFVLGPIPATPTLSVPGRTPSRTSSGRCSSPLAAT